MGSLNKFLGSPKEIEINGNKIIIHPLKVKDMSLFNKKDATEEEQLKMSNTIMQLSIPDATEEEIGLLPVEIFTQIMEEINKLNGFTDEKLDTIKKRLEQRKTGN